jgi:hypothetical protein
LSSSYSKTGHYGSRLYDEEPSYANAVPKKPAKDRLMSNNNFGRSSPSSNIVYHYDHAANGKSIYGRPFSPGAVVKNGKPETKRSLFAKDKEPTSGKGSKPAKGVRDVYEFEKKVPMHSSSLEAQKFKTIIFLSGR